MPFNFKIFYAFILGVSFHHAISESPAYLPLFIRLLWNAKEWAITCKSLEKNEQYKELKTKLGSNIEQLVLSTSVAQQLLKDDKMYIQSNDYLDNKYIFGGLEMQIKLNNFLIKENFKHFEPAQAWYLSEIDGKLTLMNSTGKNLSESPLIGHTYLKPEEADELFTFIEKTGYVYTEYMTEEKTTHRLHNWQSLSPYDFQHTDTLEALACFARKMDPTDRIYWYFYENETILNKESIDKLKERIFTLTKKCLHSNRTPDSELFKECY
ncbi:MAG TPA: hypothetical protein VL201_03325, partial [Patescibacteria group bacterium]|nr:hypothetical protein [Patescibacteria group bacterium]